MIGIWGEYSSTYLRIIGVVSLFVFTLPILFFPLKWGKLLLWKVPKDGYTEEYSHLTIYFGRCLGGIASVIVATALYVSYVKEFQKFFMQMTFFIFLVLTMIHIVGALQKIQPITETIEILFWLLLVMLTLCFYPV